MSLSNADSILESVEANDRAELYEARWNDQTASRIVPRLIALLESADRDVLLRALSTFVTIASRASTAAGKILPHLRSDDPQIAQAAIWALARVSLDNPELAIDPLISVADVPGLRKPVMQALVGFGAAARRAAPLFAGAFADPSADARCLALRGLAEVKAASNIVAPILAEAAVDKSRRVREYAAKKFPTSSKATVR